MKSLNPFNRGSDILVLSLALFTLLIHLFTCTNYELHRDELLYMAMGRHLSFGFMSTPPMMGFLAFLLQHFFGYSEMAVKLLPALSGVFSVVIIALMVKELGGKNRAVLIACMAFILSPAFLRSDNQFMPVPFDEFFWLLLAYLVVRLVNTGNEKIWLSIGLVTGVAFMNKYSIVFFAAAFFIALLLSPHRALLKSKYLVYSLLIAFVVVSPNLYWQMQHHFPVITHMGELRRTQLVNENPVTFTMGQLLMNMPGLFIWLTGLLGLLFVKSERKFRFISLAYLFAMAFLILGKGKAYYALGAYPMLFAGGGYLLEKYFTGWLAWVKYAFVLNAIAIGILIMPLSLPILPVDKMEGYCKQSARFIGDWPVRWEDGKSHLIPQDYADQTGWKQLAGLVADAYYKLDSNEQKHCIIYAKDYGQAGALQCYGKQQGLPDPLCFSDAFLFWAPDSVNNLTMIMVASEPGKLDSLYNNWREVATVDDKYFRENGLNIYVCKEPKPYWSEYYRNNVKELKDEFNAGR
jgi:hypothetical protein